MSFVDFLLDVLNEHKLNENLDTAIAAIRAIRRLDAAPPDVFSGIKERETA